MLKYFLIGVSVLAVAASGAALTNLGNLENPGVSKAGSVLLYSSASRQDEIYMDQSYEPDGVSYCTNGLSIYGGASYESADDFLPEDDTTVEQVVIWLSAQGMNLRVDFFEGSSSGPSDAPPADFYNEEVSSGDIDWEATGDYFFGYPVIQCTIPVSDAELSSAREYYWFGMQTTTGSNAFWWSFDYGSMDGPYWEQTYFYYTSYWTIGEVVFGPPGYDSFWEIWGSTGPPDEDPPIITDTYPMNEDYPSGIPPDENFAGCHWVEEDPDGKGINVEDSTFDVYDGSMDLVLGMLVIDESDLYDVIVDFEAEDPFEEGATYTVETETFDLAGNSATELWTFDTGYTTITDSSFGAIKAGFAQ